MTEYMAKVANVVTKPIPLRSVSKNGMSSDRALATISETWPLDGEVTADNWKCKEVQPEAYPVIGNENEPFDTTGANDLIKLYRGTQP